jgi:hypothetical protein
MSSDSDLDLDDLPPVHEEYPEIKDVGPQVKLAMLHNKMANVVDLSIVEDLEDTKDNVQSIRMQYSHIVKKVVKVEEKEEEYEEEEYDREADLKKHCREILNIKYLLQPLDDLERALKKQLNEVARKEHSHSKKRSLNKMGKKRQEVLGLEHLKNKRFDDGSSCSSSSTISTKHSTPDGILPPPSNCALGKLPLCLIAYCLNNQMTPWEFKFVTCTSKYFYYHFNKHEAHYWKELFYNQRKFLRKRKNLNKILEDALILNNDYKLFYKSMLATINVQKENKLFKPNNLKNTGRWRPRYNINREKQSVASLTVDNRSRGDRRTVTGISFSTVNQENKRGQTKDDMNGSVGVTPDNYVEPKKTQMTVTNVSKKTIRKARVCSTPGFFWNPLMKRLHKEVMEPYGFALAPKGDNGPNIDPTAATLLKNEQVSEGRNSTVKVSVHHLDRRSTKIDINPNVDLTVQLLQCKQLQEKLKHYRDILKEIKNSLRVHFPSTSTEFEDHGPSGGPRGKVTVSKSIKDDLRDRTILNEKVWEQLDNAAKCRLIRANVVHQMDAIEVGPRAIVAGRKKRKVVHHTISIHAVRCGSELPLRTTFYESD